METFEIKLTKESKKYFKSIEFYLLGFEDDEFETEKVSKLGADNDIFKDWSDMSFKSNFRGVWIGLDGHELFYTISECNDRQVIFQSPVVVNGKPSNLRFSFTFDDAYENGGYYDIIGLWSGLDGNGVPSKQIAALKAGDEVVLLKKKVSLGDYSTYYDTDDVVVYNDDSAVSEIVLADEYYQYVYVITDIFGNVF